MKVAVFYNHESGSSVAAGDIRRAIERHGHLVVQLVEKDAGVERLFDSAADLIVAAGGDGTVASVARAMAGHDIPLAVLPLGTANNIAQSLGCEGTLDQQIDRWTSGKVRLADVGEARGPWGERHFVEAVGGGLVTRSIATIDAQPLDASHPPDHRLELALGGYLNVLSRLTAQPWSLQLDGRRVEEEFLLVEVLNIRSIGPNFVVADSATPFDGQFTVALASERHREALQAYWQARMAGTVTDLHLDTHRAAEVLLESGDDLHLDDALFAWPEAGGVSLRVERGVLPVLGGPSDG